MIAEGVLVAFSGRRSQITVPEIRAHLPDRDPTFQLVSREAMPQGMTSFGRSRTASPTRRPQ